MELEKYQVFISSPFHGLEKQRKAVVQAVINWGHIPIALENFSPQVQKDFDVIKKAIEDCQIYILILGHRYGSIIENEEFCRDREISYTQFEFEEAIEKDLVPLVFLKDEQEAMKEIKNDDEIMEKQTEMDRLKAFHELIKQNRIFYRPWNDKDTNLEEVCGRALAHAIFEKKIRLPGWIRAEKVQMALNNIFVQNMIKNINSFEMLDRRCSTDVKEKETLALFFRETFLYPIVTGKYSLFFESGSCPAFVAKELGNANKFKNAVLNTKNEDALNLYTNNILVFLEFWMNDHLPVSMLPKSSPKEPYGATYGILDELIDENRVPDYGRKALDKYAQEAIDKLKNTPDIIPNEKMLLICSISGIQISKQHDVYLKDMKNDELQEQIDQCYGFHAGSYKNIIFKRYLYSTEVPVIMVITKSKIDIDITPNRCHFIFDEEYGWENFYKNHPLAFCIGCKIDERKRIIDIFDEMKFESKFKIYGEYAVVLATNSIFRKKFTF